MARRLASPRRRIAQTLCEDFRAWAPEEPRAPRIGTVIGSGLSNLSVLLEGARQRYVLRFATSPAPAGVDRQREHALHGQAAAVGLAPTPLLADPERGLLITTYLGEAVAVPAQPAPLAALLRRIHALPLTAAAGTAQSSSDALAGLRRQLAANSAAAGLLARRCAALARAEALIRASSAQAVVCHNDLLTPNLRRVEAGYLALDWEYAAPGDPFYDLAVCASEQPGAGGALLEAYLGRAPLEAERRHFRAQQLIYAAIDACWRERYAAGDGATALALAALQRQLAAFDGAGGTDDTT
jgi:aminoglycoside phosphotransferase (APT) family kinase protein